MRLLNLTDELAKQDSDIGRGAVAKIRTGVTEEFLSLRSNAKHKDAAEPMLKRFVDGTSAPSAQTVDLLGGSSDANAGAADTVDLLGGGAVASSAAPPVEEADLLGA